MKIKMLSKRKIILFLIEKKELDFKNLKLLQEELKQIFLKLKYYYKINVKGFYNVKAYIDKLSGIVLEIDGEGLEELEYFDGEIDMRVEVIYEKFMYQTEDILNIPKKIRKKLNIYFIDDKYLLTLKKTFKTNDLGELLEYTSCIYHNENPYLLKDKYKIECWHTNKCLL